jgi:deazaflavin-dependent oxidoreductase (nitroreductase family)
MSTNQKVEQEWETPPIDQIPDISRGHVGAMEVSDDEGVWNVAGMPHVLLRTIGRKSGKEHKVALPTWTDPHGHRIVVASFAGNTTDPAWFLNLSDRTANPEVLVQVQNAKFWSEPQILDGDDYDNVWKLLNEDRAWYNDYQAKTSRRIPLVRLPETRPAD